MEPHELTLVEKLAENDPEVKNLRDEHALFDKQLQLLERKNYLTPQEEQEVRTLKKQKLDRKTRLMEAISAHK